MESQPQNPEFRNNPENVQPCNKPMIRFLINFYIEKKMSLPQ